MLFYLYYVEQKSQSSGIVGCLGTMRGGERAAFWSFLWFLFRLKQALTLLFFLLIKLLERGAGLTGPCLAGRQRVNGPKLNRRHLWADLSHCFPPPRIFSGRPLLSRWPVQWEECHSQNTELATKSSPAEWGFHGTGPNPDTAKIPQIVLTSSDHETLCVAVLVCVLKRWGNIFNVDGLHLFNGTGDFN